LSIYKALRGRLVEIDSDACILKVKEGSSLTIGGTVQVPFNPGRLQLDDVLGHLGKEVLITLRDGVGVEIQGAD